MARSLVSLQVQAEAPFLWNTKGILASLADQFSWLLDLQWYCWVAWSTWIIRPQTQKLAETFASLDMKIRSQVRLTQDDYIWVVDALIGIIEATFLNENTKVEALRQTILQRILKDQDLHHIITSAFSVVEVISILLSTVIYTVNCTWIAPISTIPMLAWPYLQYVASKPLHDYREPIPKNYQLQLKHLEIEERSRARNPILHLIYTVAFAVSIHAVPNSFIGDKPITKPIIENTSARLSDAISWKISFSEVIRWPYFLLLWVWLEVLAAYLFLFQAKRNQKTMNKRTGMLLPFLERLPNKNQDFFLRTLEALFAFKQAISAIESWWNTDEKAFFRLIDTLNTSLKALERGADPEIQWLFRQTIQLIASLRVNIAHHTTPDVWTYPLLELVRNRIDQVQRIPKKRFRSQAWWDPSNDWDTERTETQKRQEQERMKIKRQESIKNINFPQRMKQSEMINFLQFMEWTRTEWKWSHFAYSVKDSISWTIHNVIMSNTSEMYGTTFSRWIFATGISPEFVWWKWNDFQSSI